MDRIESLLSDAFEEDAARFRETTFVEAHGGAVAARVRRRRRVRAAGYSALGVAAVAAAGLTMLPSHDEALTPADMPACLPLPEDAGDWWNGTGGDQGVFGDGSDSFLRSVGGSISISLSEESLRLTSTRDGGGELEIPVRDHLLAGTTGTGELLAIEFPGGTPAQVRLTWTDDAISVEYGFDDESMMTATISRGGQTLGDGLDRSDPQSRYWGYFVQDAETGEVSWTAFDLAATLEAFTVTWTDEALVSVEFPDGSVQEFDAGDDGRATFEWVGVTTFQVSRDAGIAQSFIGDEIAVDAVVDAQVLGPQYCLPDDAPTTTTVDPPAEVSPDATSTIEFEG